MSAATKSDAGAPIQVHDFVVPHDHPALPGHFPGNPVVPGVLLLEQVLSLLAATRGPSQTLRLPQVKFLQPLLPGQQARIALALRGPGSWRFMVTRGDTVLASGDIATTHVDGPKAAP